MYSLILSYHKSTSVRYTGNPEALSVMFLTILELWIASDRSSLAIFPILADYDIGLPDNLFEPILLVSKYQMQRLHAAESLLDASKLDTNCPFSLLPMEGQIPSL